MPLKRLKAIINTSVSAIIYLLVGLHNGSINFLFGKQYREISFCPKSALTNNNEEGAGLTSIPSTYHYVNSQDYASPSVKSTHVDVVQRLNYFFSSVV